MGAIIGGTTGAVAGSKLGEHLDEMLVGKWHCNKCNHIFNS